MPTDQNQIPEWKPATRAVAMPGPGEIHLWRVALDPGRFPDRIARHRALLSAEECERADRFRIEADAARFTLCRGALRLLLGGYIQRAPEEITFGYGPNGKPALADLTPRPVEFSVSHSGEFALIGFTPRQSLGVDLEHIRELPDADDLAARFFSAAERDEYQALPASQRLLGFFNCWTRKEAFVKAVGEGLSRPLDSFDVSLTPDQPARFRRIGSDEGGKSSWSLLSFQPAPGYAAAVATPSSAPSPSFFEYRFPHQP